MASAAARLKRDETVPAAMRLWGAILHQAERDARSVNSVKRREALRWLEQVRTVERD